MNYQEECIYCGSRAKPKVVKGIEFCRECNEEWEPYEAYDDDSGHDY